MSYLKQFVLPVKGFGLGQKKFTFEIGDEFFEHFDSEIEYANIQLLLDIDKQSSMLNMNFAISGTVRVQCDRCLDEFDLNLQNQQTLVVKFGEENDENSDEMIIMAENEHELDLAQTIYELINLSLPIKKVHGTDKNGKSLCNAEMLKKLENYSIDEESETDPRWNKLKDLL